MTYLKQFTALFSNLVFGRERERFQKPLAPSVYFCVNPVNFSKTLEQCWAIHAPRCTGVPRESCGAPRKISGIYKSTIFLILTYTLDSVKSHLQSKKFEVRRES